MAWSLKSPGEFYRIVNFWWQWLKVLELKYSIWINVLDGAEGEIPLDITSDIFQRILDFFQHFNYDLSKVKPIQKPIQTSNFAYVTDEWCAAFFKSLTEDQLGEIIMVVRPNFLSNPCNRLEVIFKLQHCVIMGVPL